MTATVAILGSGMAGCGAAHQLAAEGVSSLMFDKNTHAGGHTASHHHDGFVFDEGPHISFTKNERVRALLADNVEQKYEVLHAQVNNYWQGYWIKHPAQVNLHGLPEDLVVNILRDFVAAQQADEGPIDNYADWLLASFGKTFAETYPMEYGLKYHTTPASNMSTDWLGPRLYRPELEEVLRGALSPSTADVHYVSDFRYPSHGGFESYLQPFFDVPDLHLGHELVALDPTGRQLTFANGMRVDYDHVISSIPLPKLIPLIDSVPSEVAEAASTLACTTCVLVNVGIDREDVSENHWTYFYDRDVFFTRVSFPHLQSPNNVRPGTSSIQAECYYSDKYRPLDRSADECIEPVIADLRRCGLIREDDRILYSGAKVIPFANIIFDLDRADALATVHGYLDDVGVVYCGRYGEWGYQWTDESFLSGESAADTVLAGLS